MDASYRTIFDSPTSLMVVGGPVVVGALLVLVVGIAMLSNWRSRQRFS